MSTHQFLRPVLAGLCLLAGSPSLAADLTIQNTRAAGFADPTPLTPLPMNPGTNRGDQALIVFQATTAMWGATVRSSVPILIDSEFTSAATNSIFDCSPEGVVLAYTQPYGYTTAPNFPNPDAGYDIPLSNALDGYDLINGSPQFQVNINADIGTAGCDFPAAWYFGLDTQVPDGGISLFTTLMHEFGHGLGFSSTASPYGDSSPLTIFDYHLWDVDAGTFWTNDSASRRAELVTIPNSIAFDGDAVRADIPNFLAAPPTLLTTFNAVTTSLNFTEAEFSGALAGSGQLVATNPLDACSPLANAGEIAGKFALIERSFADAGTVCTFISKAQLAVQAGAVGVVVFDSTDEDLIVMAGTPTLNVPAAFISNADGITLQNELAQGPVSVAFGTAAEPSNTDPSGTRVLLYTPSTLRDGSSLIHWNANSYPHTLMLEYANMPDIRLNMDFTPDVMSDIGWSTVNGLAVSVVKLLDPEVPAGAQFMYITAVFNRRPTAIDNVSLNLALPAGTTFISNASSPAGCATAFPCALGPMQAGEVLLVITTVQAATTPPNPFVVTATATPSSADANDSLTATSTQPVATGGDLQVSVSGPSTLAAGTSVTITTTLTNTGPGDAAGVVLGGTVTGNAATPPVLTSNAGGCTNAFPCSFGTLPKGAVFTVTSTYSLPASYQSGASFTATVSSSTPDSNPANNTASFAFVLGTSGGSGCSSTGEPITALGVLGLLLAVAVRRRDTF